MPASRFLALSAAIPALEAADDLRALSVAANAAHPGDKGQNIRGLSNDLAKQAGGRQTTTITAPLVPGITPGVKALDDGNTIRAERERKRAAYYEQETARRLAAAGDG